MNIQFTDFEKLRRSIKKYRVYDFEKQREIVKQRRKFEDEGLDTDLQDIFSTNKGELFTILKDGSIRKATIHIVDISFWREDWKYPKFHIYFCKKIEEMQNSGRKYRYKASSGEDGKFYLIKKRNSGKEPLEICSYCLNQYNNQFNSNKTKQSFPLKVWIEKPMRDSKLPKVELDICTVPNRYTENWPKISKKRKEQEQYICQECEKDFLDKECKRFLHVHHIDTNKRNNTRENLRVLCIECHCREQNHGYMKQSDEYKKWLRSKCFKMQSNK